MGDTVMMTTFSNGSLVWVDLGHSYGRWPAEVVDPGEAKKEDSSSKYMYVSKTFVPKRDTEPGLKKNKAVDKGEGAASTSEELPLKDISSRNNANKEPAVVETMVSLRFVDDLKYDLLRLPTSRVEAYSCPSKLTYIREGLKKFSEKSKNRLVDNESTQNQLIKDVELAEVMTDNNPDVAAMLTELVHLDTDPEMLERERKAAFAAKRKRKRGGVGCSRSRKKGKK